MNNEGCNEYRIIENTSFQKTLQQTSESTTSFGLSLDDKEDSV